MHRGLQHRKSEGSPPASSTVLLDRAKEPRTEFSKYSRGPIMDDAIYGIASPVAVEIMHDFRAFFTALAIVCVCVLISVSVSSYPVICMHFMSASLLFVIGVSTPGARTALYTFTGKTKAFIVRCSKRTRHEPLDGAETTIGEVAEAPIQNDDIEQRSESATIVYREVYRVWLLATIVYWWAQCYICYICDIGVGDRSSAVLQCLRLVFLIASMAMQFIQVFALSASAMYTAFDEMIVMRMDLQEKVLGESYDRLSVTFKKPNYFTWHSYALMFCTLFSATFSDKQWNPFFSASVFHCFFRLAFIVGNALMLECTVFEYARKTFAESIFLDSNAVTSRERPQHVVFLSDNETAHQMILSSFIMFAGDLFIGLYTVFALVYVILSYVQVVKSAAAVPTINSSIASACKVVEAANAVLNPTTAETSTPAPVPVETHTMTVSTQPASPALTFASNKRPIYEFNN